MFFYTKKLIKKIINLFLFIIIASLVIGVLVSTLYPMNYKEEIKSYSYKNGIDPFLVAALINVESNYNKDAISSKDARGLMQIGPQTGLWAKDELGIENYTEDLLFDPATNIKIGTWYLTKLNTEFKGNLDNILAAYNAGSGNVSKWLKDSQYCNDNTNLHTIPFKETEEYVRKVKRHHKIYTIIYKPFIDKTFIYEDLYMNAINKLRNFLKEKF